jgi:hypothetical protein
MKKRACILAASLLLLVSGCDRSSRINVIRFGATKLTQDRIAKLQSAIQNTGSISNENVDAAILASNTPEDLVISRSLLGKIFVWGAWIEKSDGAIYAAEFGTGMSLQSALVSFELSPDAKWIHLVEAKPANNSGNVGIGKANLIDRFPISKSDSEAIEFDYSKGLQTKILETWAAQKTTTIEASYSFVYGLDNSDRKITFAQLLKLKDAKLSTMILRHSFRPLTDDEGFLPVLIPNPWKSGFIPAHSLSVDESQNSIPVAVRRFDHTKPIKWYLSSNVPVRFRDSIRKGLLAWNDAFGSDVVEVAQLSNPVDWASSRINIFQWSDDSAACGGAAAFGPSEANPVTGKIYSGKVLFCGGKFLDIYDRAVNSNHYGRDDFERELIRWAATHEVGHALGFGHNFLAKYHRDEHDVNVISSSVMDYPNPEDVMKIPTVGPRDKAMIEFAYLTKGSPDAFRKVDIYPLCDDDSVDTIPACTQFIRGMPPHALVDWYLRALADGSANQNDTRIVSVGIKQIFTSPDNAMVEKLKKILSVNVLSPNKIGSFFTRYIKANRATFDVLGAGHRTNVYQLLENFIFERALSAPQDVGVPIGDEIADEIARSKDVVAFAALESMKTRCTAELGAAITGDFARQSTLMRFNFRLNQLLTEFWR